ncbi:aminotransferase class V-fold PLP-dependent enzyme [Nonomuraea sp. KC401]|uniref:aminotransferase class V-fold PLP-dependent enzyme n=1 Tax=unclassified Nonomuraea TaxID=2593643 RepID=UPI0010FD0FA2|nr:aminotransferase class V-fold PLP-dependent enzyme [Nonomuraea sp. KC401]NBE96375.1 aminotransferase class V-fold PLP-dependent enzyme [Nonomuraea sp. K271]TLF68084.1 aminotransferase class V-fold PLP-dependent enzyme [Nonomuraea sp. KC401]
MSTLTIFTSASARAAEAPAPTAERRVPAVLGADLKVPVKGGRLVSYANLDYAASAPCLEPVSAAVAAALPAYSSVHRGAGYASQLTTARYEQARHTVSAFAGARPGDAVIFTRNTTDATNLLARCLPEGTTTVVFDTEHHASLLPWPRSVRLAPPAFPGEAVRAADETLAAIDGPKLLVVTAASNVTGELWPIAALAHIAHRHGARILVDAAQLAPHRRLNLTALDLDYVAFSGHKLYAPFGAGVLIGRRDWLAEAEPYLKGGGAVRSVAGGVEWHDDPEPRHEAGTPNVLGAIALAAACDALSATGWTPLVREEERLIARLRAGLASIEGVRELSLWGDDHPRVGIVSFAVEGRAAREVAEVLSGEYGIGVRDGKFCAHPFVRHLLGTENGLPDGGCEDGAASAVRASIGIGTTQEHVDRLIDALRDLTAR